MLIRKNGLRGSRWLLAGAALVVGAVIAGERGLAQQPSASAKPTAAPAARISPLQARAIIQSCLDGQMVTGEALLTELPSAEGVKQVQVSVSVSGLPDGLHAVHIHENGVCEAAARNAPGAQKCMTAGGHFDPGPNGNSMVDANHPFHAGDLVNLEVKKGQGQMQTLTSRFTLSPGPLSLFDENGAVLMIHDNPDSYCPDGNVAACAGGTRAACGVLQLVP